MLPKDSIAAIDSNRILQLERVMQTHEEGYERMNLQYSDLREGFTRLEEYQSRDISNVTDAIARLSETVHQLVAKDDTNKPKKPTPPDILLTSASAPPARLNPDAIGLLGSSPGGQTGQASSFRPKLPRVDFPKFSGSKIRSWLQKVQSYFLLHPMEDRQKNLYCSLNFLDTADVWFQTEAALFVSLSWQDFSRVIQERFSEELSENVIREFKSLPQRGILLDCF